MYPLFFSCQLLDVTDLFLLGTVIFVLCGGQGESVLSALERAVGVVPLASSSRTRAGCWGGTVVGPPPAATRARHAARPPPPAPAGSAPRPLAPAPRLNLATQRKTKFED